jgi:hypothetical protein
MPDHDLVVRAAVSDADLEAVYRGRHRVYAEEMGAMARRPDRRIRDAYDTRASTLNLVIDGPVGIVGGARFVVDEGEGTTADAYFDFRPFLPPDARRAAGSMLWLLPEARGRRGLIAELMAQGHGWVADRRASHVLATVNPDVADRFSRVGYRSIGSPFVHGADRLPVQPMVRAMAA